MHIATPMALLSSMTIRRRLRVRPERALETSRGVQDVTMPRLKVSDEHDYCIDPRHRDHGLQYFASAPA